MTILEIKNLHVQVADKEIVKGLSLTVKQGETHALMGPNGSGKSTLSYAVMGHPRYKVTKGEILLDGKNINALKADERAKLGLFLGMQYPAEVPGVGFANFLRTANNAIHKNNGEQKPDVKAFRKTMEEKMKLLKMNPEFTKRYLNEGFSGGEKKRAEILQMTLLTPKFALLDEPDSGLDVDALKSVAAGINAARGPQLGLLLITHYQRILDFIKPDFVHVMHDGKIVKSGTFELAKEIEAKGYDAFASNTVA